MGGGAEGAEGEGWRYNRAECDDEKKNKKTTTMQYKGRWDGKEGGGRACPREQWDGSLAGRRAM